MGPHCSLVSEKIVCLDVTLKAVVLKTPGQTNSGALCLLQDFLRGAVVAPRGPMVAYFDKMSCSRCNEAPLCGFLPSVDSCPVQFADELWWRAFSASPAFQSVRWLFRSIGPRPHTPSVFCYRWSGPMTLGLRRYSMPALSYGAFWSFSSWSHLFWGEIKSPR